jgi:hypothetical protein
MKRTSVVVIWVLAEAALAGINPFIQLIWGPPAILAAGGSAGYTKPSQAELKKRLSPMQYSVTQEDDTEAPFENEFWNNKRKHLRRCRSGGPLRLDRQIRLRHGWPASPPVDVNFVVERWTTATA